MFELSCLAHGNVCLRFATFLLGSGGFGGTALRYGLNLIHGYCFGYCVYVLAATCLK